jgi:hypothetical protein
MKLLKVLVEASKEIVADGIKGAFLSGADSFYTMVPDNATDTILQDNYSQTVDEVNKNYGPNVGAVYTIAAYKHDPYESKTVQDMRLKTAVVGVFIFFIYVFYSAGCVNLSCSGMGFIERAQYVISQTPFGEYKNTLIRTFGAIFLVHYIFKLIIMFNTAVTSETMYTVFDSIQFTSEHWVMYFIMSLCYGAEFIFFAMRILLMDLIAGSDILIGALFAFSFTRNFSVNISQYFGKITIMQFIIVLLTAFGIAIIRESPSWLQMLEYFGLMIILVLISASIVFGFTRTFKSAKVLVKGGL